MEFARHAGRHEKDFMACRTAFCGRVSHRGMGAAGAGAAAAATAAAATAAAAIHAYLLWCCFVGCLPGLNWQGGSCNPQAHAGYSQSWGEAALTLALSGRQASGGTLCALDLAYCSPLGSV